VQIYEIRIEKTLCGQLKLILSEHITDERAKNGELTM